MTNEGKPKLVEVIFRNESLKTVSTFGILLSETKEEVLLGHNFLGTEVLDATTILVKDILSIEDVKEKEINIVSDLQKPENENGDRHD